MKRKKMKKKQAPTKKKLSINNAINNENLDFGLEFLEEKLRFFELMKTPKFQKEFPLFKKFLLSLLMD